MISVVLTVWYISEEVYWVGTVHTEAILFLTIKEIRMIQVDPGEKI
jgi:hypothetical protein